MVQKIVLLAFAFMLALAVPVAGAAPHDVIVVRGDIPTDYVVASGYAHSAGVPIVLLSPDEIPRDIEKELAGYAQNGYSSLLIIGGNEAISPKVESRLDSLGFTVERLWDWNRYSTAARVAIDLWGKAESTVMVNGESYQYLLVAQRLALKQNNPVLFSMNATLTSETQDALGKLGVKQAFLVGNPEIAAALQQMGISVHVIDVSAAQFDASPLDIGAVILYSFLIILALIILAVLVYIRRIFRARGSVPSMVLTGEEQEVIKAIRNNKGSVKQNELPEITGFSRPKVCRLVQVLEGRGVIKRKKRNKTFVLRLKSEVV